MSANQRSVRWVAINNQTWVWLDLCDFRFSLNRKMNMDYLYYIAKLTV